MQTDAMQTPPSEPGDVFETMSAERLRTLVRIYRLLSEKRLQHIGELEVTIERLRRAR